MSETDAQLVAHIRSGDAGAFESLMRRYFRMAFLIAFAQVNNRADAEDVCQDAFLRCWERIADCREPARVAAWIATIVRNTAHNRRSFLRLRGTDSLEHALGVAAEERADADAERNELRSQLSAAMNTLTSAQREVILLHDFEGWTHPEIAARLGLSSMMSRRHLSDARKRLRAALGTVPGLRHDHD